MNLREEEKKSLIYLLNELAEVDGSADKMELKFIDDVARQLHLTTEDVSEIKSPQFKLHLPKNENERILFFFHALQLVELDRKILSSELSLLKKLGFKLGLNPLLVDDLLKMFLSNLSRPIPPDKIPRILKKYLN